MTSTDNPSRQQEIQLALNSIVETSEKWLGRLRKRQVRVRLASAFLTTVLVFFITGGGILSYLLIRYGWIYLAALFQNPAKAYPLAGGIFLFGVICGFLTYFFMKRRHESELKELSSSLDEMKKKMKEAREDPGSARGFTEDALSLADKIMTILPQLVRKRNQDSLLFGVAAFIFTISVSGNLPVAILVGVIVWLYFRYETRKTYDQEISKFEEQKRIFDQRKNEFLDTL